MSHGRSHWAWETWTVLPCPVKLVATIRARKAKNPTSSEPDAGVLAEAARTEHGRPQTVRHFTSVSLVKAAWPRCDRRLTCCQCQLHDSPVGRLWTHCQWWFDDTAWKSSWRSRISPWIVRFHRWISDLTLACKLALRRASNDSDSITCFKTSAAQGRIKVTLVEQFLWRRKVTYEM